MFVWVFFWSLAGVYVLSQFFVNPDIEEFKTFLIVWIVFWLYFEYKTVYALRWRKSGKEIIEIKDNKLSITNLIGERGIPRVCLLDHIKNIRLIEENPNNFFASMNKSYWVVSGETITLDYQGKQVNFAMQLDPREAAELCKMLKYEVQNRKED